MTVFNVTYRKYGSDKPWDCKDFNEGLFSTRELADRRAKDILGDKATCNEDFFVAIWTTPSMPRVEVIISEQVVFTE
jgi:hypothetical protein